MSRIAFQLSITLNKLPNINSLKQQSLILSQDSVSQESQQGSAFHVASSHEGAVQGCLRMENSGCLHLHAWNLGVGTATPSLSLPSMPPLSLSQGAAIHREATSVSISPDCDSLKCLAIQAWLRLSFIDHTPAVMFSQGSHSYLTPVSSLEVEDTPTQARSLGTVIRIKATHCQRTQVSII